MIGGFFKMHWLDPQHIVVKIDDKTSPLTSMFHGQDFDVYDETYTLTYQFILAQERAGAHEHQLRQDELHGQAQGDQPAARSNDFGLSWIKRDGTGPRVLHGPWTRRAHLRDASDDGTSARGHAVRLLGDLKADDTPKPEVTLS